MVSVTDCSVVPSAQLRQAVNVIERLKKTICAVVDTDRRVLGTVSDGDVRRALLSGYDLNAPVVDVMNPRPLTAMVTHTPEYLRGLLRSSNLEAMPLVNSSQQYCGVVHRNDLAEGPPEIVPSCFSAAVIMAGGEGRRLRPLTEHTPKPMVDVGGVPLIERQIRTLASLGIPRVFVAINYLGHVIESHFGDGSRFDMAIEYLREEQKLGTGGALSLLPDDLGGDLLVINGDIVTLSDFNRLGQFHREQKAQITIGAIHYRVDIPFGVISTRDGRVESIREKPSQNFLCNAGIYAISSSVTRAIPAKSFLNMTDLVADFLSRQESVSVFPIYEFWSDVGTVRDLEVARRHLADMGNE
jgi:dTDP-glucose pyrophosphorylase